MKFKNDASMRFCDIPVDEYFVFRYEGRGNNLTGYTPVLQKINDTEYKIANKNSIFNDTRKKFSLPKINGFSYENTHVYYLTWDNIKSDWSVIG